ncbi:SpoIID/LytB domain-containing protein [Aquibacillus halophilus]|nr:SpoIID/LytB domain-containing protein [Aquibacillus halophilus]
MSMYPNLYEAEEMVRVRLVNHVGDTSKIEFDLKGSYFTLDPTLKLEEGVSYTLTASKDSFLLKGGDESFEINHSLILIPESYDYQHVVTIDERPYLGAVEMTIEEKEFIRPINQLPLEDYLKGVVPFEVFPEWGIETLKAQAMAARTYAASHLHQEMDDTISFQVYGGYTWSDATTEAVNQTKDEVIMYKNKLIDAFYSASNGGLTESNANVWGGKAMPYFPIKEDPYDPTHPWEFKLNQTQINLDDINWDDPDWWDSLKEKDQAITLSMKKSLQKNGYPGEIKILSVPKFAVVNQQLASERSIKGSITIDFLQKLLDGTVLFQQIKLNEVNINQIRPMIGGNTFKSYFIEELENNNQVYTMKGRGYGHGVGMSQWGAHIMGEEGKSYKEIIEFYYPGTSISKLE